MLEVVVIDAWGVGCWFDLVVSACLVYKEE